MPAEQATAPPRRRTWLRRTPSWVGAVALLPSVIGTVLTLAPPRDDTTALLAAFSGYSVLGYAVATLCFLFSLVRPGRRRLPGVLAAVCAILLACHLAWLAPLFEPDDRAAASPTFTVLSLNLEHGGAAADQVVEAAQAADVVVLVETTPPALAALAAHGWRERFPYALGDDEMQAAPDTAVYSRYPLQDSELVNDRGFYQRITTVVVPEVGGVRLMPQHPCNPYCGGNLWAIQHEGVRRIAAANLDQPLLLAGDFNAVDQHAPMQDLYRLGLRSATDLAGAGWLPTYPAGQFFPPLLPIDHVLVNDRLAATDIRTVRIDGTDHRGLLATIALAEPTR